VLCCAKGEEAGPSRGDGVAQQAGFAGSRPSYLGCWRAGWLGPSSPRALSLLFHKPGLRLEGDTP
jgi:hypothetical protein